MTPMSVWGQSSNSKSDKGTTTSTTKKQAGSIKKIYTCVYKIDAKQQETIACSDVITVDGDKMYIGQDNVYRLQYYKTENNGSKTIKSYIAEDDEGVGCFVIFSEDKSNEYAQYQIYVAYDSSASQRNVLYITREPEER